MPPLPPLFRRLCGGLHVEANILFDEGAQRSFITKKLANTLRISPHTTENVSISAFGDELSSSTQLSVATINVVTLGGEQMPISVLVVPVIAAPLHNTYHNHLTHLKYLQGLRLANPVTKSNFEIALLIAADYFWQFVDDHIIRGDRPTAMDSKLGYLLTGPILCLATHMSTRMHYTLGFNQQQTTPSFGEQNPLVPTNNQNQEKISLPGIKNPALNETVMVPIVLNFRGNPIIHLSHRITQSVRILLVHWRTDSKNCCTCIARLFY